VTVCDYTNKTVKVYRNGVQFETTLSLTGTPLFPSINIAKYIGASSPTAHNLANGSIDEVKIYNRGLSTSEISNIYNQTKGKYQ